MANEIGTQEDTQTLVSTLSTQVKSSIAVASTTGSIDSASTATPMITRSFSDTRVATVTHTSTAVLTGLGGILGSCIEGKSVSYSFLHPCELGKETAKCPDRMHVVTWWTPFFDSRRIIPAKLDHLGNLSQSSWHSVKTDKTLGFAYMPIWDTMLSGGVEDAARIPETDLPTKTLPGPLMTIMAPESAGLPILRSMTSPQGYGRLTLPLVLCLVELVAAVLMWVTFMRRDRGTETIMGRLRKGYCLRCLWRQLTGERGMRLFRIGTRSK